MREVIPLEKFIPYDKLSKKKRKELDAAKRGSWNGISPVTRKSSNPKAYNRAKTRNRRFDPDFASFFIAVSMVLLFL